MFEEKDDPRKPQNRLIKLRQNDYQEENIIVVNNNDINEDLDEQEESASILIVDDDMINLELHQAMIN